MGRKDDIDGFYRLAKKKSFRARSAFKLLEIDEEFSLFKDVKCVVDLCAAPGSWSQVLSIKLKDACIVSVDIQEIAPIENVFRVKGDITEKKTIEQIEYFLNGKKTDLVVCDGAPDVSGITELDEFLQDALLEGAFSLTKKILKKEGCFVAKIFYSGDETIKRQFSDLFEQVTIFKPESSRKQSKEHFIICEKYLF